MYRAMSKKVMCAGTCHKSHYTMEEARACSEASRGPGFDALRLWESQIQAQTLPRTRMFVPEWKTASHVTREYQTDRYILREFLVED